MPSPTRSSVRAARWSSRAKSSATTRWGSTRRRPARPSCGSSSARSARSWSWPPRPRSWSPTGVWSTTTPTTSGRATASIASRSSPWSGRGAGRTTSSCASFPTSPSGPTGSGARATPSATRSRRSSTTCSPGLSVPRDSPPCPPRRSPTRSIGGPWQVDSRRRRSTPARRRRPGGATTSRTAAGKHARGSGGRAPAGSRAARLAGPEDAGSGSRAR